MGRSISSEREYLASTGEPSTRTDAGGYADASFQTGLSRWRGLYFVEPETRDVDGLLALRGTRWHAQARFLAAFSQGMRRLF